MTDYHHTKFGLIWMKGRKVTEGGGIRPPQVENVLKRPGEIELKPGLHVSRKDRKHMFANRSFKLSTYALAFT